LTGPCNSRFLLLALFCFTGIVLAQTNDSKTVLILYDGGSDFASIRLMDRGIESTLRAALPNRLTIFREHMDLTRFSQSNYEHLLRDFYRSKYSGNRPDVLVTVRSRPLDFALNRGDELFPQVPTVSSAMDARQVQVRKLPHDVTGNSVRVRYWPTIALALKLQPETDHVVMILGASPNDHALEALVRDELHEHERPLKFTYLSGLTLDALMQRVADLPRRTVIVFVSFAQAGGGRSFLPNDVLARIAATANAPTYVASDDVIDTGVVGGDVMSFAALGTETAGLILRILRGESAAEIPFVDSSARVKMLDARQLERWGIPLSRVPKDSIILHRVPSLWEEYQWHIAGGLSLIALQGALIAALVLHRRRRRLAEANLELSEVQGRAAVLEERERMARDMHDTLAQGFTGVIIQLEAAQQAAAQSSHGDMESHILRASDLARQSLGEARRSIRALRPQALENTDLCVALDAVMKQMTSGAALQCELTIRGQRRALSPLKEENLLRIFQEILTNTLKHSRAKIFRSFLSYDENAAHLETQDDGVGFDLGRMHDGLGLIGIRERVNQMNGELVLESQLGTGTHIYVALPN
jgi:signal transduction histidine kinase